MILDDYSKLKRLLFDEELATINRMVRDIRELEHAQEKDVLVERLSQLITQVVSKAIQENRGQFYGAIQPIISKGLLDELHRSDEELQKILYPVILSTIQEQVHKQKDLIVDALYPIMGNMISKYVSSAIKDMMLEINQKLENSLSFARWKRKFRARLLGISEAQMLMQEADFSSVDAVFLIHKESGLLIVDLYREENYKFEEAEMVASMLSAIRSFVNDWISNDNKLSELSEIEYGNSSISIESAGSSYLAVVTRNKIDMKDKLAKVLSKVVDKYSRELMNYDGDTSSIDIADIKVILSALFVKEHTAAREKKFPILGVLFVTILLAAPTGWYGYTEYLAYKVKQKELALKELITEKNRIHVYDMDITTRENGKIILSGMVLKKEEKERIEALGKGYNALSMVQSVEDDFVRNFDVNFEKNFDTSFNSSFDRRYETMRLKSFIVKINGLYRSDISYTFKGNEVSFSGTLVNETIKKKFIESAQKNFGHRVLHFDIRTVTKIENIYFEFDSVEIAPEYTAVLDRAVALHKQYGDYFLKIYIYNDEIGPDYINRKISYARADKIREALIERGFDEQKVIVRSFAKRPDFIDSNGTADDSQLSRCATFEWELNK